MAYKVLIVDDSKLARMAAAKALSTLHPDWVRVEAANADEALNHVRQANVDIALLDFNMPGRDGLDLAADLRKVRPQMPVAIVSANYQEEILNRAKDLGATFLPKPLTQAALEEFLNEAEARLKDGAR